MKRGNIQTHDVMDDRKKLQSDNQSSEKYNKQILLQKGKIAKKSSTESQSTSNLRNGSTRNASNKEELRKMVLQIFSFLKKLFTEAKPKIVQFWGHPWLKSIVGAILTILVIPQLLNAYNVRKSEEAALQSTIQRIYINYDAGNYSETQQDIYNIYPKLQKKKDYQTLLDLSDILLYTTYQDFYINHKQLTSGQKDLINQYANNALEYAKMLKETTAYIKICIHIALFNISEYEFTLDANYIDTADDSLDVAEEYFNKTHDQYLTITDQSEADLACQFFNLKNLQYQVSYYRALIAHSFLRSFDSANQMDLSSSNTEQINPNDALDELCLVTTKFIEDVHTIEEQNAEFDIIPKDTIQHMKIRAGVAYIESGNLLHEYGGMVPICLAKDDSGIPDYNYSAIDTCADLFRTMERTAIEIKDYEDLVMVYKSAQYYYYLNYIAEGNNEVLNKYNEYFEKLQEMDSSGDSLCSYYYAMGNGAILGETIEKTEEKLSKMEFDEDPFSFSMMKYSLGTLYMDRALFYEVVGDITNAKLDYKSAKKCFSSALIYFTRKQKGIFEDIQMRQLAIDEKLSTLSN